MDIKIAFLTSYSEINHKGLHHSSNGWVGSFSWESRCLGLYVNRNDFQLSLQGYEEICKIYKEERPEYERGSSSDGDGSGNCCSCSGCSQGKHNNLCEQLNNSILNQYGFLFIPCDDSSELKYDLMEIGRKPFDSFYEKWHEQVRVITKQLEEIDTNIKQLESRKSWLNWNRNRKCVQNSSEQICSLINQGLVDINNWKHGSLLDSAIDNEDKMLIDTIYKKEKRPNTIVHHAIELQDCLLENKSWIGFFSDLVYGGILFLEHWEYFAAALPLLPDNVILNIFSKVQRDMNYEGIQIPSDKVRKIIKKLDRFLDIDYFTDEIKLFKDTIDKAISEMESSGRDTTANCIQNFVDYYFW